MRSTNVIIPLAFVVQAHSKESMDKLVDKVFDRVLSPDNVYCRDLENSTLAKDPAHLASTGTASGVGRPTMLRQPIHCNSALAADLGYLPRRATLWLPSQPVLPWSQRKHAQRVVAGALSEKDNDIGAKTLSTLDSFLDKFSPKQEKKDLRIAASDAAATADIRAKTISTLDAFLNISSTEEKKDSRKSVAKDTVRKKPPDQRNEFRKLVEQSKNQMYIATLLRFQMQGKWLETKHSDLRWLGSSEHDADGTVSKKIDSNITDVTETKARQENVMTLPVMAMPHPVAPGEVITLDLFEPRWITLFAKLIMGDKNSSRLLKSASGWGDINLDTNGTALSNALKVYEMEESADARAKLLDELDNSPAGVFLRFYSQMYPGYGRFDESHFVGSRRFGICLKPIGFDSPIGGQGQLAEVGTVAEIISTDVRKDVDNFAPVFQVVARGVERFRATQLRQEKPYHVVDAVPLVDVAEDAKEDEDQAIRKKVMNTVSNETQMLTPILIDMVDTMMADIPPDDSNPEKVNAGIQSELKSLSTLALGSLLLRSKAQAAQALLASTSAAQRRELINSWLDKEDENWFASLLQTIIVALSLNWVFDNIVWPAISGGTTVDNFLN